jgi:hypothetical protein
MVTRVLDTVTEEGPGDDQLCPYVSPHNIAACVGAVDLTPSNDPRQIYLGSITYENPLIQVAVGHNPPGPRVLMELGRIYSVESGDQDVFKPPYELHVIFKFTYSICQSVSIAPDISVWKWYDWFVNPSDTKELPTVNGHDGSMVQSYKYSRNKDLEFPVFSTVMAIVEVIRLVYLAGTDIYSRIQSMHGSIIASGSPHAMAAHSLVNRTLKSLDASATQSALVKANKQAKKKKVKQVTIVAKKQGGKKAAKKAKGKVPKGKAIK